MGTNSRFEEFYNTIQETYSQFLDVLNVYQNFDSIIIVGIQVQSDLRGSGIGTKIMNEIVEFADSNNKSIVLYTSEKWGSSLRSLIRFYERFSFHIIQAINLEGY